MCSPHGRRASHGPQGICLLPGLLLTTLKVGRLAIKQQCVYAMEQRLYVEGTKVHTADLICQ